MRSVAIMNSPPTLGLVTPGMQFMTLCETVASHRLYSKTEEEAGGAPPAALVIDRTDAPRAYGRCDERPEHLHRASSLSFTWSLIAGTHVSCAHFTAKFASSHLLRLINPFVVATQRMECSPISRPNTISGPPSAREIVIVVRCRALAMVPLEVRAV